MSVATFPPPTLQAQLAELKRERGKRNGVYPVLIAKGTLKQAAADHHNRGLDGAIATLERGNRLGVAKANELLAAIDAPVEPPVTCQDCQDLIAARNREERGGS